VADALVDADHVDVEPASDAPPEAFVLGGRLWRRPSPRGVLAVGVILSVVMVPVRGLARATGSSMEEGFMLVFPRLVQQGRIPNVDFLHLYGPGSLHVLSVWYRVFGYTLESQRAFGLLQHLGIIFAVYALTRAWGHLVATFSALTATMLVLTPIGLSALAWHGAVALGLWSVVFAVRARRLDDHVDGAAAKRAWLAAGFLAGAALSFRPDLVVALALASLWLLWRRPEWRQMAIGAVVGLVPMWIHLAMAGPVASFEGMVIDPVVRLRPGRELPAPPSFDRIDGALQAVAEGVPPWWGFPSLAAKHQLFVWFFAVIIIAVAVPLIAWWRRRRGDDTPQSMVLMAGGLFGLGIIGQALQRPDSTHLAWVACVSWPLLVPIVADAIRPRLAERTDRAPVIGAVAGGVAVATLMFVVCPFFTYRHYVLHTRVAVGNLPTPFSTERDGRRFWWGEFAVAKAGAEMITDLDRLSEPGERLVVGPADLSRTIYSDVAYYFLFDELEPATYYIEMDPGLADAEGSRLADDLLTADWVILTNFWTGWYEPNASSEFGSQAANQVIADHFCLVGNYEDALVLLYRRCAVGDGVSPAAIGDRPPPEGGAAP
jgi:hypothetical protein